MTLQGIFRQIFGGSNRIRVSDDSSIVRGDGSVIENCRIELSNSKLILGPGATLRNVRVILRATNMVVGRKSILECDDGMEITSDGGELTIGNSSRIRGSIVIRFGGRCRIGEFTAINEETEIRCDESISIGSFNMISYGCQINDTNTHTILPVVQRRELTRKEFPIIGSEYTKPTTKPVVIGDDCWLGKRATILKGVTLGDEVIVGTMAVVTKSFPARSVVAGNPATLIKRSE